MFWCFRVHSQQAVFCSSPCLWGWGNIKSLWQDTNESGEGLFVLNKTPHKGTLPLQWWSRDWVCRSSTQLYRNIAIVVLEWMAGMNYSTYWSRRPAGHLILWSKYFHDNFLYKICNLWLVVFSRWPKWGIVFRSSAQCSFIPVTDSYWCLQIPKISIRSSICRMFWTNNSNSWRPHF